MLNSFEETKVDGIISSVMGGRKGLEWNGSQGFCDFKTKQVLIPENNLPSTLNLLCADNELDRKFFVIKDAHLYFDDPIKGDIKAAIDLYTKAIDRGSANAKFLLGNCYYDGIGVKQDTLKGGQLRNEALREGSGLAHGWFLIITDQFPK